MKSSLKFTIYLMEDVSVELLLTIVDILPESENEILSNRACMVFHKFFLKLSVIPRCNIHVYGKGPVTNNSRLSIEEVYLPTMQDARWRIVLHLSTFTSMRNLYCLWSGYSSSTKSPKVSSVINTVIWMEHMHRLSVEICKKRDHSI